jgi:four helix bundle protein
MSDKTGFRFEKLDVWQKAMEWVDGIYQAVSNFPDNEKFGLTSQLKRSSLSVASNIAEGSGRKSNKDFARFIEVSYGSLMEAVCQCMIAKRQKFMTEDDYQSIRTGAIELSKMLSGLRSHLIREVKD